jgi:hypothetical protein
LIQSNKYTLDGFEGDVAIFLLREDETKEVIIPKAQLPGNFKKGDIVEIQFYRDGSIQSTVLLEVETEEARATANSLLSRILEKNN